MDTLDGLLTERRNRRRSCLIMGILNVTPDSFYDGGEYNSSSRAIERARTMVASGVDIIDVGGESTRPGADPISPDEEKRRVLPVIESIRSELTVPISVDTTKPEVADEALRAGASMLNDVSGLEDPTLRDVVVEHDCPVCIMHMQGTPRTMQENPEYDSVVEDVGNYLESRAEIAVEAGVDPDKIILDPGIGFGKSLEHNRKLLSSVGDLRCRGHLVLIGHSRKSFIGQVLQRDVDDRLAATLGVSVELLKQGVDLLRVHDVEEHVDVRELHGWLNGGFRTNNG